jgi:cytoskeletal protein CcmA (bactofilin family)
LSDTNNELTLAEQRAQGSRITRGLTIKGQISGCENLYVNGTVEGVIDLRDGTLTLETHGKLISEIRARNVVIFGQVEGKLTVRDGLKIMKDGSLVGDVVTGRILIEDGAHLKGSIEIERESQPR